MSKYSGSLTREQFLFRESRIIAKLIIEGYDDSMIIDLVYKDNLFQFPTEKWIKNLVNVCIGRVRGLDNMGLINQLAYGPLDLAKQINLYSIMKSNRLVKEFMIEVVGSKLRSNENYLSRVDLNLFFIHLQEQNVDVNKWTDSTLQKIKQVLIKFLIELGYMKSLRDGHLQPIYVYPELIDGIKLNRDNDMLIVFNGVNEQ
jgi:hypothetical protein